MKKIHLLFVSIGLFITNNSNAQYIKAGQHGGNDYFYDIVPDTNLIAVHNGTSPSCFIDINGDAILDFEINAYDAGTGTGNQSVLIKAENSNQIARRGMLDTCFDYSAFPTLNVYKLNKMATAFDAGDSISNHLQWQDSSAFLCYDMWTGYNTCSGNTFDLNVKYLGVRVFVNTDTLYGWIKISTLDCGQNNTKVRVEEYAGNISTTGIQDNYILKANVYPNPVTDVLNISIDKNNSADFILYDISSRKIIQQKVFSNTSINIKDLAKGVYLYELRNGNGLSTSGKIVKE